jgi:hypothetical protein
MHELVCGWKSQWQPGLVKQLEDPQLIGKEWKRRSLELMRYG